MGTIRTILDGPAQWAKGTDGLLGLYSTNRHLYILESWIFTRGTLKSWTRDSSLSIFNN